METLILAKRIGKYYRMGEVTVKALREVDFELYEGEFVVILGPSGSGKSTLLNLIGGMDTVSDGELYYGSTPLHLADSKTLTAYRRSTVGFVFQFYNLIPSLTAYENVSLSAEIAQQPFPAGEMLERVGLADRLAHFPSQLSGGEQQRVALARAMVKNPRMLLCDEPTGALDYNTSIQVLRLLKEFCEAFEKTVVVITHNTAIARIADRVFYLKDGRLARIETNENPLPPEKVTW
ncbi:MAG: ABC transporter ATP-binding protein [Peptococcaceae bacterium]|nr:ABC transporter ATP-binding protein [Peptococcaceae bacterium]